MGLGPDPSLSSPVSYGSYDGETDTDDQSGGSPPLDAGTNFYIGHRFGEELKVLASSGMESDIKIWTPKAINRAVLPTNIVKRRPKLSDPRCRGIPTPWTRCGIFSLIPWKLEKCTSETGQLIDHMS